MTKNSRLIFAFIVTFIIGALSGWGIHKLFPEKEALPTFEYIENTELGGYTLVKVAPYENESIVIPNQYNGDPVIEIGTNAFSFCQEVKSVSIPATVEVIGYQAFSGCLNLTDIIIPNSVEKIDNCAFQGCKNLTKVFIGKNVSEIGEYVFNRCYSLVEFSVHEKNPYFASVDGNLYASFEDHKTRALVRYAIGKTDKSFSVPEGCWHTLRGSFTDCKLVQITLPDSLYTAFGFETCEYLTSLVFPKTVTNVSSFTDCKSLKHVVLPKGLTHLPSFRGCTNLETVILPNDITEIGQRTFLNCSSLKSITIPESVVKIGEYAFSGCTNLTSAVFENSAYWVATCSGKDDVAFEKTDIADHETAAKYLVDEYDEYYWEQ